MANPRWSDHWHYQKQLLQRFVFRRILLLAPRRTAAATAHEAGSGLQVLEKVGLHNLANLLLALDLVNLDAELLDLLSQALLTNVRFQRGDGQ